MLYNEFNNFYYTPTEQFILSDAGICIYNVDRFYYERVVYDYEVIFVTEGRLSLKENDNVITLEKNQGYIFFPNTIRSSGEFPIKTGTTYFWIHFNKQNQKAACTDNEAIGINRFSKACNANRLCHLIKWYIQDNIEGKQNSEYHNMLFHMVLTEFSRSDMGEENIYVSYNPVVSSAYSYIMENFNKDLSVKKVADFVGCTPDYITTLFKKTYGKTLVKFINDVRIEYAKNLLITTNKSIKEIAAFSGYNSDINFRECFKKSEGLTPKEFRQLNAKEGMILS